MNTGSLIFDLCDMVEKRVCTTTDCPRIGRLCDGAGCQNRACAEHAHRIGNDFYCDACVAEARNQ